MVQLTLIKDGTYSADDFNRPFNQLNSGKEDKLPLPSNNSMVLTSDISGNRSWTNLLKVGLTADDAFRADYGIIAYDHSQSDHNFLPLSGGILTGDVNLTTNGLIFTSSTVKELNGNLELATTGYVDVASSLGLRLDAQSFITATGTTSVFQVNGNNLTITNTTFNSGALELSTDKSSIQINNDVQTNILTSSRVNVGVHSLRTDGLWINNTQVIDTNGNISGANIDFTADYESSWMYVTKNTEVNVPHSIGFIPRLVQITFATTNTPTTVYTVPYHSTTAYSWWYSTTNVVSTYIESMDATNFRYKTGNVGVFYKDGTTYTAGYVKVMLWK
jgi:hypothetical protein